MNSKSHASFRRSTTALERLKTAFRRYAFTTLVLVAIAAGLSGCASRGHASAYRTHEMGPPKATYRMSNQTMPNYPGR